MKGFPIGKDTDHNLVAPQPLRNDSAMFFSGKISKTNENFRSKKDVAVRIKLQKKTYFDKILLFVNIKNL
jgi:hypothetical protein